LRTNSSSGGGRQVIPFFEITGISAIASGAYGTVYRGHWSSGGMIVALKTARKSATTGLYASVREPAGGAVSSSGGADVGFAQEIQFSEGAAHRNIVQCFGITNGIFPPASRPQDALVMEFVPTTLYQRIHQEEEEEAEEEQEGARQAGGFTPGVRRSVASGIVSGMIFLHKHKKVAHLDIKSHNILMDQDRPKIADFGLTVETAQSLRTTIEVWDRETKSGEVGGGGGAGSLPGSRDSVAPTVPLMEGGQNVRGTGAWMAPEIVTRQGEVTTKADVYSFGVVLWELVAPRHDLLVAWVSTA
jgi:serine/threonine protein kinase